MSTATENTEAAILNRLLNLDDEELTPEVARFVLGIRFRDSDHARMDELAAKARAGTLAQAEQRELESYIHVGDVLALWHSKARRVLSRAT